MAVFGSFSVLEVNLTGFCLGFARSEVFFIENCFWFAGFAVSAENLGSVRFRFSAKMCVPREYHNLCGIGSLFCKRFREVPSPYEKTCLPQDFHILLQKIIYFQLGFPRGTDFLRKSLVSRHLTFYGGRAFREISMNCCKKGFSFSEAFSKILALSENVYSSRFTWFAEEKDFRSARSSARLTV